MITIFANEKTLKALLFNSKGSGRKSETKLTNKQDIKIQQIDQPLTADITYDENMDAEITVYIRNIMDMIMGDMILGQASVESGIISKAEDDEHTPNYYIIAEEVNQILFERGYTTSDVFGGWRHRHG